MINPRDLQAIQGICQLLYQRACRARSQSLYQLLCKQQVQWINLAIRLNTGETK